METEELTTDDRRQILNHMIVDWRAARYRLEIQHRVAKTIGDPKEHLESLKKELERCEKAIDALQTLLAEIPEEEQSPCLPS